VVVSAVARPGRAAVQTPAPTRIDPYDILVAPLVTEKSTMLRETHNQVAFIVSSRANKSEVKKAVEEALKVKVEKVNIITVHGKRKRMGKFAGRRPSWKKGIVTLKAGEKIELFEGS
jgi:large subunit ribosomal protein L23